MLNHRTFGALGMSLWLLGASGCGGADTKKPASAAPADKSEKGATDESKGEAKATASKPSPEPKPEAATEPTTKRSPKDIITAPDVVFVLAFAKSEVGEEAQQACEKNPRTTRKNKRPACRTNARKSRVTR